MLQDGKTQENTFKKNKAQPEPLFNKNNKKKQYMSNIIIYLVFPPLFLSLHIYRMYSYRSISDYSTDKSQKVIKYFKKAGHFYSLVWHLFQYFEVPARSVCDMCVLSTGLGAMDVYSIVYWVCVLYDLYIYIYIGEENSPWVFLWDIYIDE